MARDFMIGDRVGNDAGEWGKICQVIRYTNSEDVVCVSLKGTCSHKLFVKSELRFVD